MEQWKNIEGYEGLYQISNTGKVKSCLYLKDKILKNGSAGKGYLKVELYKNKQKTLFYVHRLVATAFIPNISNKKTVNHIDGNKKHNNCTNLEWNTYSENHKHAFNNGLKRITKNNYFIRNNPNKGKFGKYSPFSKSINQYDLEGNFIKIWGSNRDIQRSLGISSGNISQACNGKLKTAGGFIWEFTN